jgi:hypothetical protein
LTFAFIEEVAEYQRENKGTKEENKVTPWILHPRFFAHLHIVDSTSRLRHSDGGNSCSIMGPLLAIAPEESLP